jgi:hypothetical protein
MTDDAPSAPPLAAASAQRVMAILAVVALHLLVYWLAGWVGTAAPTGIRSVIAPRTPLLVLAVSFVQAWCSLGAIWLACSRWPSHVNTLIASLISAGAWVSIVMVLAHTNFNSPDAAGWLASLATQCLTVTLAVVLVERIRHRTLAAPGGRFTILFLMIWTGVVGLLLGAGRILAEALGWTWTGILAWQFFPQLQVVGLLNSLLAVSLWTALRQRPTWKGRLLAAAAVVGITVVTANLLLHSVFHSVGAQPVDIYWLYAGQSAFLLATLVPLHLANKNL